MSENFAQKSSGTLVFGGAEEAFGIVLFDNLAIGHENDPVGNLSGKAHFMGNADHGHSVTRQRDHSVEDFLDHFWIKRRGRLVKQHGLGFHAQRASDSDALLLAARQLGRVLVSLIADMDAFEIFLCRLLGLRS